MTDKKFMKGEDIPFSGSFVKFPDFLHQGKYSSLSLAAVNMYVHLLERFTLSVNSVQNGNRQWLDERGEIFCYFDQQEMAKLLRCTAKPLRRAKRELVDAGLVSEVRQGQMKPNRIYLHRIDIENTLIGRNSLSREGETPVHDGEKLPSNKTYGIQTYSYKTDLLRHDSDVNLHLDQGQDAALFFPDEEYRSPIDSSFDELELHDMIHCFISSFVQEVYRRYGVRHRRIRKSDIEEMQDALEEAVSYLTYETAMDLLDTFFEDVKDIKQANLTYFANVYKRYF